jgi:site-specific DNA recombinase
MDFARMMSLFETHGVSFVSVTQQFNTTHSMGRLTLNILLSFAQFEREIISERTRDKIMASKRKGKWFGGISPMGYRNEGGKLIVVEEEACRVREIFAIYLRTESLGRTVAELKERGWKTRTLETARGRAVGGREFEKSFVYAMLTNVTYIGRIVAGKDLVEGQHEAIVDGEVFARVQGRLAENARTGGAEVRNVAGAVLKGLIRCGACDAPMHHSMTSKDKGLRYRYYVCHRAKTEGRRCCPSKSLPAEQIERFVLDHVKGIGKDRTLLTLAFEEMRRQESERLASMEVEQRALGREGAFLEREATRLASDPTKAERLAEVSIRLHKIAARLEAIAAEMKAVRGSMATRADAEMPAAEFDPIWSMLSIRERSRLLQLVVKAVEFDGGSGELRITFHPEHEWLAEAAQELNA